ncbi:hypothetical protein C3B59_05560 [Cryobacterium zongtaii]|uniref:Uncharacterized protein n=1 Tax=Cryobacterium zongtaii TaxID=1259217 RepID=A0A2S3ZLM4_9MICO|nr:PepSY domain-containing protein [Cryobacterium zongtaii]POH69456.1 hypothetical protein C3B59_05560 [Cryobacterium zongtaii]
MKKKTAIIVSAAGLVLVLGTVGITYAVTEMGDDTLTGNILERASNAALAEVGPGTVTTAERNDDGGSAYDLSVRLDNGGEVDVELNESFDVVWVGDFDNDDDGSYVPSASAAPSATATTAPTASTAEQAAAEQASAEAAALAAVGSGRVTEFDRSDDANHLYEVEVTRDNGQDVDVELAASFVVLTLDNVRQ